jgi:hypothetical protein
MRDREQGIHFSDSDHGRVHSYGEPSDSQLHKCYRSMVPMLGQFCNGVLDIVPEIPASNLLCQLFMCIFINLQFILVNPFLFKLGRVKHVNIPLNPN